MSRNKADVVAAPSSGGPCPGQRHKVGPPAFFEDFSIIPEADLVQQHYEVHADDLVTKVTRILDETQDGAVTGAQLAGLDQFHVRGLAAMAELGKMPGLRRGMEVLDAGSGLGGPSRHVAETYGCRVIGVDLTPSFVAS